MIPVFQDKFGEEEGNCMAACVASIFEMRLRDVPNFVKHDDWFKRFCDFSRDAAGHEVVYHVVDGVDPESGEPFVDLPDWTNLPNRLKNLHPYHIVSGPSERGLLHATVGWRGEILHDPHPSGAGLIRAVDYCFFRKIS